jgi:hypothetical protein
LIGWRTGALHDKDILSADAFVNFDLDFAIGEGADLAVTKIDAHFRGNSFGKSRIGISREYFQSTHGQGQ